MTLLQFPAYNSKLPQALLNLFYIDLRILHISYIAIIATIGFLIILPGIRGNERKYSFVRHSIWALTLLGLVTSYYTQSWIILDFPESSDIRTGYVIVRDPENGKSLISKGEEMGHLRFSDSQRNRNSSILRFSPEEFNHLPTKVFVQIGLKFINVTTIFDEFHLRDEFDLRYHLKDKTLADSEYANSFINNFRPINVNKLLTYFRPNIDSRRQMSGIGRALLRAGRGAETMILLAGYFWILSIIMLHIELRSGIFLQFLTSGFMLGACSYYFGFSRFSHMWQYGVKLDGIHANMRY